MHDNTRLLGIHCQRSFPALLVELLSVYVSLHSSFTFTRCVNKQTHCTVGSCCVAIQKQSSSTSYQARGGRARKLVSFFINDNCKNALNLLYVRLFNSKILSLQFVKKQHIMLLTSALPNAEPPYTVPIIINTASLF